MQFDDFDVDTNDLHDRLSSWRSLPNVVEHTPKLTSESSVNIEEVRIRQRRIAAMCLNTVRAHDNFVAELKAYIGHGNRDASHQQRVEDEASFALGVFEQTSALALEKSIQRELENNLPKEKIIETVYVQPPSPPRSWLQRMLGI
jgi:hypothetical protein